MILVAVILMDLLAGMEFDLFVPSFPALQSQFHLSPSLVEALLSLNFIGYCLSLFFVGSLSDRYGRKPIILWGLGIFIFGSIICLEANSYTLLFMGRFLQGVGIAAPAILSFLIIADAYPLKKQQSFLAVLNGVMNVSIGFAPVIGSYVTLYFHWQGNFIALLLLGLLALGVVMFFIPFYPLAEKKEALSFRGYIPVFQSKPLILLIAHIVFMCIPYWVFVGMSPLLYMKSLRVSLAHFGYYQGVLALVFALGSFLFSIVLHKFKQKNMLYFTCYIFMASFMSVGIITAINSHQPLLITLALLPFIIGQIIPGNLLYPLSMNVMPEAKGKISAVLQGSRLVLTAIALQIAGHYYDGSFQSIGIIILIFILLSIITLLLVIKNRELMSEAIK